MKLVLATANPDKAQEMRELLSAFELIERPAELGEIEETGDTLIENALLKAKTVSEFTNEAAVAEDTGLEVDALGGAPGVITARYAGENATYADNVEKILTELSGNPNRRARFRTVALAYFPDGTEIVGEGAVEGKISEVARGKYGFGYDPVFIPKEGDGRTFAEMTLAEKQAISHRGRAFRMLSDLLLRRRS